MYTYDVESLNRRFGISNQLRFAAKAENFVVAEVSNAHATATIALQGAHVMTYQPRGQEPVLWLSEFAKFAPGKSIRGGVPICWPWFGAHASDSAKPAHGYARTVPWQVVQATALENGVTQIIFELVESDATRAQWPHPTPVRAMITIGPALTVELVTRNSDTQPVTIGEALHTYFQVSDIGNVEIHGLSGCTLADKVEGFARKVQEGPVVIGSEVDRVYVDTEAECVIADKGYRRKIRIAKSGSRSTVVWNPWIEKAEKMGDFGAEGYRRMVCVESGNALENCVVVAPGAEHRLKVVYGVEKI